MSSGRTLNLDPILAWRLPLLLLTVILTASWSPSWLWWAGVAFPAAAGMLALHLFEADRLQRWLSSGLLPVADGLLVSMALFAAGRRPLPVAGFLAVALLAVLLRNRRRALVSATLCVGLASMLLLAWPVAGIPVGVDLVVYLGLLGFAARSFGILSEQMTAPRLAGDETRKGTNEQWALLGITETIGSTLDLGQVMRSIVKQVGDLMDIEGCSILLADPKAGGCFVVASKGHPEVDMLEVDLDKYPEVRRALETREPVLIKDVATSPLVATVRRTLLDKGYRSMLVVPLVYGNEVVGTLFLRTRREEFFSPNEIRFCKLAAGASANALKNALLYRDVATEAEKHRATGEKLRRVLDGTPDMIVATNVEGRVHEFNRGAEVMTGWSAERARGQTLAEVLGIEVNGDGGVKDVVFRRFDGEALEISLAGAQFMDANGDPAGRVWIGRDVTQLRRVERSLAQAERLSALGEVVAGVAHELNNPLSGVVGYAELLRMHAAQPQQIRDLDRIVESAMRCQKIVFKLLSFARQHPPEKKNHDLNECVSKVVDLKSYHLRSSQITTAVELTPGIPRTSFDFHQIEQVVLNLLNNAEQAIAPLRTPGTVTLRTGAADGHVFVQVEDNGPGVPASIRSRIFDPFFTTKEIGQGTGLGLAVSYGIVKEHGGRIEISEASPGSGARFTVWLPVVEGAAEELPEDETEAAQPEGVLRDKKILVVEDEPLVLDLISRVLTDDGAHVTLAHDGQEALDRLATDEYDLIVADLRMPNVSGQQLYERIAERRPQLLRRFVFATGDLVREESVSFLENVPNRILTKPLEVETVRRVLSQAIGASPSSSHSV